MIEKEGLPMNVSQLKSTYPSLKTVIAVSKTHPIEKIESVKHEGFRDFGENKVQELFLKAQAIEGVTWHMIGHLQTNKVKDAVRYADWIHSVDSIKLLQEIEKQARKFNKKINILMQVNLTHESSKSGLSIAEIDAFLECAKNCEYALLKGIMVIGPTEGNEEEIRDIFKQAKKLQTDIQKNIPAFEECSMGMSTDYQIACQEGATMLRIGTLIFGSR